MSSDLVTPPGALLGRSSATLGLSVFLERASAVDAPVLLVGESGTGKSHVARLIHRRSARAEGPFVCVNCAGVPDGLFEAEFFGQRKGAFTGASESRPGLFEQASGGSLFLDEVGELPSHQQAKLLAVLEEGQVRRVGGTRVRTVDVRVIAATCRNLDEAVAGGMFRVDLYHRLALLRCEIAPLRARREDLGPLIDHFLGDLAVRHASSRISISEEGRSFLADQPWPGNVRELSHVLEAAFILAGRTELERADLETIVRPDMPFHGQTPSMPWTGSRPVEAFAEMERSMGSGRYSFYGSPEEERATIQNALARHRGNRTRTARALGMSRNTLRARMQKYGM